MPAQKRILDRVEVRLDTKTAEALTKLKELYGIDKPQSEIIREAIIEKANRETKRERARSVEKP